MQIQLPSTHRKVSIAIYAAPLTAVLLLDKARELGIEAVSINTFPRLENFLVEHQGDSLTLFLEAQLIETSFEELLLRFIALHPLVIAIAFHCHDSRDKKFRVSLTNKFRYGHRYEVWDFQQSEQMVPYLQACIPQKGKNLRNERILPADELANLEEEKEEQNDAASIISTELSIMSASIHYESLTLKNNFIHMREQPRMNTNKIASALSDEAEKGHHNFLRSLGPEERGNLAEDIPPDQNACARFGDALWINNRFTYLLLGARGCGKTTFLNYLFHQYIPRAYPDKKFEVFIIDFVTYDYVSDAQTLAFELQERLFAEIYKESGRTFGEYISSDDYNQQDLLWDKVPDDFAINRATKEFAINALSGMQHTELNEMLMCISDTDNPTKNAMWRIKEEISRGANPKLICRMIAYFAMKSSHNRETTIADQILTQATQRPQCHRLLYESGYDPGKMRLLPGEHNLVQVAKTFIKRKAEIYNLFFVIDNADRSIFPAVELDIFRTAWAFFPRGTKNGFKMVFAMRTDTYYRHRKSLTKGMGAQDRGYMDDVRDYSNLYNSVLRAPTFTAVALRRIRYLVRKTRHEKNDAKASIMHKYAKGLLQSNQAQEILAFLFEGDLRRSLELFEYALGSHHMERTALYQDAITEQIRQGDGSEYVAMHKFLSALMLGAWNKFRQERNVVFLNVYNARIMHDSVHPWRNTLILPRIMDFLHKRRSAGAALKDLYQVLENVLGYPRSVVSSALGTALAYRIIETADPYDFLSNCDDWKSDKHVKLTQWGDFYCQGSDSMRKNGLMLRLEFIQSVYWDTLVPRKYLFEEFSQFMRPEILEDFVKAFCEFIRDEEAAERDFLRMHGLFDEAKGEMCSLLDRLQSNLFFQLNNIYQSLKP